MSLQEMPEKNENETEELTEVQESPGRISSNGF